jgi:hypothetical protein
VVQQAQSHLLNQPLLRKKEEGEEKEEGKKEGTTRILTRIHGLTIEKKVEVRIQKNLTHLK